MKLFPSLKAGISARSSLSLALVILSCTALPQAKAATLWATDFVSPPYDLNETVIGKEGWTLSFSDVDDLEDAKNDAKLVSYAAATGGTALEVISSSTKTQKRTRIHTNFEKVMGPQVEATVSMAFNWQGTSNNGTALAFHENESMSPVIVAFNANNGMTFSGTYANLPSETILEVAKMAQDSFYQLSFVFDFDQRVFSLDVRGAERDGTPFHYSRANIGFRSNTPALANGIDALRLMNNRGDYIRYYVDSATVQSIPEASASTLMGVMTGAMALGYFYRKPKR